MYKNVKKVIVIVLFFEKLFFLKSILVTTEFLTMIKHEWEQSDLEVKMT